MAQISHHIFHIICRSLNILVSPAGDGELLRELHPFMAHTGKESQNVAFLLPVIVVSTLIIGTIRYTLGHTLVCLLIMQSLRIHSSPQVRSELGSKVNATEDIPLSRHVVDSLRILYRHHGISIFYRGVHAAVTYWVARITITALLGSTLFRPAYLRPVADIASTVAVSELHLYWTGSIVSARGRRLKYRTCGHDRQRWKRLVIPSAAEGAALALLRWISKPLPVETVVSMENGSWLIVALAILRAFFALVTRLLVLSPLFVNLTLIEVSFLNPVEETLDYSPSKTSFLPAGRIYSEREMSSSFKRARTKQLLLPTCLWLSELHIKKCLIQLLLESLVFSVISLMI